MSFRAKRELLVQVAPRYRAPRHGQRSAILDEFVAVTGYERKYAIPAAARSDPTTRTHPSTTNSTVRRRRATSAGHRVHGRQRDLWQAFGAPSPWSWPDLRLVQWQRSIGQLLPLANSGVSMAACR